MSLEINTDDFWKDRAQKLAMALADTEALEAGTAERCRMWRDSHIMSQAKVTEQSKRIKELEAQLEKNNPLLDEAANEIDRLRAALEHIVEVACSGSPELGIALEALKGLK